MAHGGWGVTRFKGVNSCHPERRHYARGLCKSCYRNAPEFKAKRREYYQANKDAYRAHGEKAKRERRREAKRYGISTAEILRMIDRQGGACAICGRPPISRALNVDHNHKTGKVRGMLCGACNQGIGMLQDSPEICERAAEYLRRHDSVSPKTSAA